jgi:hypothetical protein
MFEIGTSRTDFRNFLRFFIIMKTSVCTSKLGREGGREGGKD